MLVRVICVVLVEPGVVVIEGGLLDMEKSGVTFGEMAEVVCDEIWVGTCDFAGAGIAAGSSIKKASRKSTRIFPCGRILRDLGDRLLKESYGIEAFGLYFGWG